MNALIKTLICLIFVHHVAAAPVTEPTYEPGVLYLPDSAIALDDGYNLSIQGVFAGMILICVGLLLATRSAWDFSPTGIHVQNLSGFTTLGFVTWVMLANFEPSQTYGTNRQTIYLIVPFIVGLVVIFCMAITYQLYLMLVGGLGALAFGLWILGWKDNLSITSEYGRAILLTVLVVVFMIMSLVHHRFHILGAALAGSYLFFMGLDIFFHTGFLYCITTALDKNPAHAHHYVATKGVYIMQSCLIVCFIVAYVIQSINSVIARQHELIMLNTKRGSYLPPFLSAPAWPLHRPAWFSRGGAVATAPPPAAPPA